MPQLTNHWVYLAAEFWVYLPIATVSNAMHHDTARD